MNRTTGGERDGGNSDRDGGPRVSRRSMLIAGSMTTAAATVPAWADQKAVATMAASAAEAVVVRLVVNGDGRQLSVDPRQSLLDVLRETLDLTGTKKGCNSGACGACTVLVNGRRIVSCLALAVMQDGAEVQTIEGLSRGDELHPLQTAFIEHEGFQCGYCTPGQIMSGVACIAEGHANSPQQIRSWMSGNICRCGAYPGIVTAIAEVAKGGRV